MVRRLVSLGDFNRDYLRIPRPRGLNRWDYPCPYEGHDEFYLFNNRVWVVHNITTEGFVMGVEDIFNDYEDPRYLELQGWGEDGRLYKLSTDITVLNNCIQNYTSIGMDLYVNIWNFQLLA